MEYFVVATTSHLAIVIFLPPRISSSVNDLPLLHIYLSIYLFINILPVRPLRTRWLKAWVRRGERAARRNAHHHMTSQKTQTGTPILSDEELLLSQLFRHFGRLPVGGPGRPEKTPIMPVHQRSLSLAPTCGVGREGATTWVVLYKKA